MSKSLILIIFIFGFWLYITWTDFVGDSEKEKSLEEKIKDNELSVGQGQRVNYRWTEVKA